MRLLILSSLAVCAFSAPALPSLNLLSGPDGYLVKEYINAITAYGPGLGVYTPYTYVDVSYDNIPFVGKIPVIGKDGTSSRLGVSPFYPPGGNPSNPWPPLYKARPLPLHVPEPQDVVAVPLDEEALHGEPLFPPELVLPSEADKALLAEQAKKSKIEHPENPFGNDNELEQLAATGVVDWPSMSTSETQVDGSTDNNLKESASDKSMTVDSAQEKTMKDIEASKMVIGVNDRPKSPFRSRRILLQH